MFNRFLSFRKKYENIKNINDETFNKKLKQSHFNREELEILKLAGVNNIRELNYKYNQSLCYPLLCDNCNKNQYLGKNTICKSCKKIIDNKKNDYEDLIVGGYANFEQNDNHKNNYNKILGITIGTLLGASIGFPLLLIPSLKMIPIYVGSSTTISGGFIGYFYNNNNDNNDNNNNDNNEK